MAPSSLSAFLGRLARPWRDDAALRASPDEEAAFRSFARENVADVEAAVCAMLDVSILLLWPFDRLVFTRDPGLIRTFDLWRPETVGLVALAWLLVRARPLRAHAYGIGLGLAGLAMANSAFLFARFGGLRGPFMYLSYDFQFMLVPMLVPLADRIAGSLWFNGCFVAGLLAARPSTVHDPYFGFFLLAGLLVDVANVAFGHMVHVLARRNFLQRRAIERQAVQLADAIGKSERLLLNILPAPIAERLKEGATSIADRFGEVTVLFADICDFTPISEQLPPEQVVELLQRLFVEFDRLVERHGVEKIKTIGDAYMVAGGLPTPRPDHAAAVADLALAMAEAAARFRTPDGRPIRLRIGLHSGPVVAGVIGLRKFSYDLWGDTVNVASRMESHGVPGAVTVSRATRDLLGDAFAIESRGRTMVKGKGEMELFVLAGRSARAPAA